ncbi:MAG: septal ring lytic transglycosylase RlpA family protein, partial [Pseudomonadota bacterium]
ARTEAPRSRVTSTTTQTENSDRRLEYRYPDQPDTVYGAGGARRAQSATPMMFSSDKAAILPAAAREYASAAPATHNATPRISNDPAITAGGFDARATAARVQSERQANIHRAAVTASAPTSRPVSGTVFHPAGNAEYDRVGAATLIAADLEGKPTANGEIYDRGALSAAHPTLPLPSLVHITNTQTGRETVVRVNDRGPIAGGGLIELSDRAAHVLGINPSAEGRVRVRYLGPAPVASELPAETTPSPTQSSLQPVPKATIELPAQQQIGAFFVQLGSFSDISNAERLHRSVSGRTEVKVVPVKVRGSDFFRVLAGPFGDRSTAAVTRDRLAEDGVADGVVISAEN